MYFLEIYISGGFKEREKYLFSTSGHIVPPLYHIYFHPPFYDFLDDPCEVDKIHSLLPQKMEVPNYDNNQQLLKALNLSIWLQLVCMQFYYFLGNFTNFMCDYTELARAYKDVDHQL